MLKGEDNLQFNGQAPFFGFVDLFFDPPGTGNTTNFNITSQPFVASGQPNPFPSKTPPKDLDFATAGFLPFGGSGVFFVNPNLRTPYTYQYNLSLQRELPARLTAEVGYLGSTTHKQTALTDTNAFILGTTSRRFNTLSNNTSSSFSFLDEFENVIDANYNGLDTRLTKTVGGEGGVRGLFGLSFFTLSYSWGKSVDNGSGFRQRSSRVPFYDHGRFRAVSDYDITQRVAFSGGWELPFDRACGACPKRLTRGWNIYPIVTWRTGFPLDVFAGLSRSSTRRGPSGAGDPNLARANFAGSSVNILDPRQNNTFTNSIAGSTGTGAFWFNPSDFNRTGLSSTVVNPTNPYGTLPRNLFRGPGRSNFDLSVSKTTALTERVRLKINADMFNALNHAEFVDPSTTITSSLFGQITNTFDPRIIQLSGRIEF